VLVEPLAFLRLTRHINKVICKVAQEKGGGLAIFTSGFNSDWLKVVIVKELVASSQSNFHEIDAVNNMAVYAIILCTCFTNLYSY